MKASLLIAAVFVAAIFAGCVASEGEPAGSPSVVQTTSTLAPAPPILPRTITTTSIPVVTFCAAGMARAWHGEYQNTDYDAATITFAGTDAGESMNIQMAYDQALDYLLIKDQSAGWQLYARGARIIATDSGTHVEFRDVGSPSYTARFIADLDENVAEDLSSDWFTTPTSAFTPSCVSYGGQAAFKLAYSGAGVQEEWVWDTAGNLHYASFKRTATSTDIRITLRSSATPITPPFVTDKAASLTYSVLDEGEFDGYNVQVIQVEPGTYHNYYSAMTLDLFSGETLMAELKPSNDWTDDYGAVYIEDRGQIGVLDEGDILSIAMDPAVDGWLLYDSWSDSYYSEDVVDASGESLEVLPETGGELIARHYEWTFDGGEYYYDLNIPVNLLEYYEGQDFTYTSNGRHNYPAYVATQYDDTFIQSIADELLRVSAEEGYSDDEALSMALNFVQSLEYTSDSVTTGYDDFPRYPIVTLAEYGGDCEDTAILYAAIVQAMGYGTVLINPPGHMATGVLVDSTFTGATYTFEGERWAYAETTGNGWAIGQIPQEYKTANAKILTLEPQAVVVIDSATIRPARQGYYPIQVTFSNDGLAPTAAGRITIYGMNSARTLYYDSNYCTFTAMAAGNSYTCDVDIRADARTMAFQAVLQSNDGYKTTKLF